MFVVDAVAYVVVVVNVDATMSWLMSSSMQLSSFVDAIVDSTIVLMVSSSKRSKSMRMLPVLSA